MPQFQVHMLTHDELDEEADAVLIAERLEEGRSSNVGDEWIVIEADTEEQAIEKAEALFGDKWFADQADEIDF